MAYSRERIAREMEQDQNFHENRRVAEQEVRAGVRELLWPSIDRGSEPQTNRLEAPVVESEVMFEVRQPAEPKYPLNLQGLIQWLETKNPREQYNWTCGATCVVAQFLRASTGSLKSCPYDQVCGGNANYHFIGRANGPGDWTFGRALQRAREVQSGQRPWDWPSLWLRTVP